MYDIEKITCFADDGFSIESSHDRNVLVEKIETRITNVSNWYRQSGLKINEAKTCLCLFYYKDAAPITITLNQINIKSQKTIKVLGVIFDQKLQWAEQVAHCISKSSKALTAIRLIRRFFNTKELLQLVTSNFYSIFYYNSEIWHLNSLKHNLKNKLLSASAKALKICIKYNANNISHLRLHEIHDRAPPEKYLLYKHALSLHKLYNSNVHSMEWVALNVNQINTSRQTNFISTKSHKKRVGLNALANRFFILNNKIPLAELSKSLNTFKIFCKIKFMG